MSFWDKAKKILVGEPPAPKPEKSATDNAPTPAAAAVPEKKASSGSGQYKRVKIERGSRGWGGPLVIEPVPGKHLIYSVTGGGIHPVAQRIADLTGGTPFDGFKSKANFDEIAVAVIDCGGTARVGVYPMKGVLTVDIHSTSPAGPLMKYIKETNFVSGVSVDNITLLDG
jgi:sorbitol-specific phosphotransferase system component IIBC